MTQIGKLLWVLMVWLALLALTAGCGGGDGGTGDGGGGGGGGEVIESPVDPATAGTISGKVLFTGTAPELESISMEAEPTCQEKYPDGAFTETVITNDNGTLKNAFIYVKEGLGDLKFPVPQESVLLDQSGCRYIPHVFGVQVEQELIIRNSDGILHNIHPMPTTNRPFNLGQPVAMDTSRKFSQVELFIPIECDVHDWMLGYVSVLNHPYFATTGDDGSFKLPNLPPGDYVIEAWHEKLGTQTMNVTVGASESVSIEFTFGG
jgi:hypothetical protein